MRKSLKPTAIALGMVLLLGGCSTIQPMEHSERLPAKATSAAALAAQQSGWDDPPVITEGVSSMVLITPTTIPDSVRNRRIELELEPGATVGDLVAVLGRLGITTIVADQEAAGRQFFLPRFKGTLSGLLSAVTRATDTWFVWHDGTIVVSSTEKIGVSVPQEADFAEELSKGLAALGVKNSAISWQAGMASLELTPNQFTKVRTYLERFTSNAAVVTIQMAVVNVTLNQNAKQGIDWEKLSISAVAGTKGALPVPPPPVTTGSGTGNNSNNNVNNSSSTTNGKPPVSSFAYLADTLSTGGTAAAVKLAGGTLGGALFSEKFSFEGMFGFLETYGNAETKQNVMLKTVTGSKVEFKSLTQIPYVEQVNVSTTGNTNGNSNLGSSQTAKADDGITVVLTPSYDAAANSVTIDFSLSIKAVLGFNELSAGNQLGTLSQPTTAERSFTDKLRVRPGQTAVVGGLTYDSVSDNRGAPLYLKGTQLESQTLKVDRQTMFIVLRPTVMRLGQVLSAETGQSLDLLPQAEELAEPAPATSKSKKK